MSEQDTMARFEMVQQALQTVDAQLARIEEASIDLRRAMSTLDAISDADGEQETLVPIGGGLHIRARVDASQAIVTPIGRGYAADMDVAAAREALAERAASTDKLLQERSQEAERLAAEARRLANQLQS